MRIVLIPLMLFCCIFSCSKDETSKFSEDPPKPINDQELQAVLFMMNLDRDLRESLEIAYLVYSLEAKINKTLVDFAKTTQKLDPMRAMATALAKENNMSHFGALFILTPTALLFSSNPAHGALNYQLKSSLPDGMVIGLGVAAFAGLLSSHQLCADQDTLIKKSKTLKPQDINTLSLLLKSDTEPAREARALIKFLELEPEDQREFRAFLNKEFIGGYTKASVHAEGWTEKGIAANVSKNINVFESMQKFKPSQNKITFSLKAAFLAETDRRLQAVSKPVKPENIVALDILDLKIHVLSRYREALSKLDPETREKNQDLIKKLQSLLEDRVKFLQTAKQEAKKK